MHKRFALIGAAGYIAPRHMLAIKETGNELVAALDPFDSVGVIDSHFQKADFFTEFERFDRHIDKLRRSGSPIDFVTICSPNYLHDAHIRFGLRQHADVICEKPLVLNPWNVIALQDVERESGKRIYNILQLRLHPEIISLKKRIESSKTNSKFEVDLSYITSRGNWYYSSWKGNQSKSGGIATNIGVHFYDMLGHLFGEVQKNIVHIHEHDRAAGFLEFKNAKVRWFLSINRETLPLSAKEKGVSTFRSITIDNEEIEFSTGFTNLHTVSYKDIINGNGFGLSEVQPAIEIVHQIRNQKAIGLKGDFHPMAKAATKIHPFKKNYKS